MKNKNLLLNLFVALGFVAAVVGLFLNFWTAFATTDGTLLGSESVGLFPDFSWYDDAALATIAQVLLIVGLALVLMYVVLYALEYFKVLKHTDVLRMIVAACSVLVAGVALVLAFIFCGNHTESQELLGHKSVEGIKLAVGFYFTAIGTVVAGVFGALASRK